MFLPDQIKLAGIESKPDYGGSFLRYLLHWPRFWEVTYHFEVNPKSEETAASDIDDDSTLR